MKIVYFQREDREMNSGGKNLENVYIYVQKGKLQLKRGHNGYKREHNLSEMKGIKVVIYVKGSEEGKGNELVELWKLVISTNVNL